MKLFNNFTWHILYEELNKWYFNRCLMDYSKDWVDESAGYIIDYQKSEII